MEDSIEVMLQERNSKLLSHYRDNRVLAFAAGAIFSGIYGLWAMFCLPGIKVPFRLKVPFLPSTKEQTENVMRLLEGRQSQLADLGSGDGRLVFAACSFSASRLTPCCWPALEAMPGGGKYHTLMSHLFKQEFWKALWLIWRRKLLNELPFDAEVVVCRFPFPHWPHSCTSGSGLDQVWAYNVSQKRDTCSSWKTHP
ncbi:ATP synthase subunit C lysine N-methyltransferase-like [Tachysurus vachellii]|uniref:ATP synthase subunit C lysine N-methyltransferase-like n=1 Tax=Tachysurus vachellii TaxID=175792 RepID=UPI00296AE575|nr:ATP synthase subunit C lysine N-methyltransferase-like [Tachysurus vachellii]